MTQSTATSENKLKLIIDKVHNLPTPPIVFTQITKVINDPNTSAYEVGSIISEDPALTAKVLKLTNSSFYGIPRTITNVKQAIVILGLEAVKSLVISASVFDTFSKNSNLDTDYLENFWRHSLSVAFMSKIISRQKNSPSLLDTEMAFSAGLLHDIGKLIIISHLAREHQEIKTYLISDPTIPEHLAESEVMGFSHADLGSYLAAKWNLPENICKAILNHHTQSALKDEPETSLIHLANFLAHELDISEEISHPNASEFYDTAWATLNLDSSTSESMLDQLRTEYGKAETFVKMAQGLAS